MVCLCIYTCSAPSAGRPYIYTSVGLSIYLSIYLSISQMSHGVGGPCTCSYLSIYPSIYLSIYRVNTSRGVNPVRACVACGIASWQKTYMYTYAYLLCAALDAQDVLDVDLVGAVRLAVRVGYVGGHHRHLGRRGRGWARGGTLAL